MLKGLFLKLINPGTVLKGKSDNETSDFELNNIATTSPSFFFFFFFFFLLLFVYVGRGYRINFERGSRIMNTICTRNGVLLRDRWFPRWKDVVFLKRTTKPAFFRGGKHGKIRSIYPHS